MVPAIRHPAPVAPPAAVGDDTASEEGETVPDAPGASHDPLPEGFLSDEDVDAFLQIMRAVPAVPAGPPAGEGSAAGRAATERESALGVQKVQQAYGAYLAACMDWIAPEQRLLEYKDYVDYLREADRIIPVPAGIEEGDSFFASVLAMFEGHLSRRNVISIDRGAVPGDGPGRTRALIAQLRVSIVLALYSDLVMQTGNLGGADAQPFGRYVRLFADVMAPGSDAAVVRHQLGWIATEGDWDDQAGDVVLAVAADRWGLRLTVLRPGGPVDFGPAGSGAGGGGVAPRRLLLHENGRYHGVTEDEDDPPGPAAELLPQPAEPVFKIPEGVRRDTLPGAFLREFRGRLSQLTDRLGQLSAPAREAHAGQIKALAAGFLGACQDAAAAGGAADEAKVLPMSESYQRLLNMLDSVAVGFPS
jgi:hypothetical protein